MPKIAGITYNFDSRFKHCGVYEVHHDITDSWGGPRSRLVCINCGLSTDICGSIADAVKQWNDLAR